MKQHQPNRMISRAAAMLLTVIMAFAGAQTAGAQEDIPEVIDASGLAKAFKAKDVSVVNVTDDITGVGNLYLHHTLTINLNGHTISGDELYINVDPGCSLTINGEGQDGSVGNIISGNAYDNAIGNLGTVTISNVNITTNYDCAIWGGTLNIGDNVSFNGWTYRPFNTESVNIIEGGNYNYDPWNYNPSANVVATVTVGGTPHYFENLGAALAYIDNNADKVDFSQLGDTYTIHTATDWDTFCDMLEGGESFSGKTVWLDNDITVTRCAGSGAAEDLTANDRPFCGTFDGGGNKLTFKYGSADSPADENNIAPFRYVNNATIQHLHVDGDIYTRHTHAGGIVGQAYGTTNITDCRSSVNIISSITGDGTHGGIMSCSWTGSTTSITGCLFDGSIQSASGYTTNQCGGFVGWRNATINVSNSLLTADLSTIDTPDGLTYPSATFVRNGHNNTITNCYYTRTLGTAQGKQLRTIAAGEGINLGHDGVSTEYSVSGITAYKASEASGDDDPFIAGFLYNNVLYAGSGDEVSLTLANSGGEAPLGYQWAYSVTGGATLSGTTLTMADEDVTVSFTPSDLRSTGQPVPVSYINATGQPASHDAIALDGTEGTLGAGWYFVGKDIDYTATVTLDGDVNLILADGKTMSVSGGNKGINADDGSLTIYGQTLGTGTLNATATATNGIGIYTDGIVTINGGTVNATGTSDVGIKGIDGVTINGGTVTTTGIMADGDVTINGGKFTATDDPGICSNDGTVTLGWTSADDFIRADSYSGVTVKIADGQSLHNGSEVLSGTVSDLSKLNGKTLIGVDVLQDAATNDITALATRLGGKQTNVVLQDRKLWKDGDWNTLVLPFAIADIEAKGCPLKGATVRQLKDASITGTTLTLNFDAATTAIAAGTPYIVKWDGGTEGEYTQDPVFQDVTVSTDTHDYDTQPLTTPGSDTYDATLLTDERVRFIGTYDHKTIDTEDRSILFLGAANTLYYPDGTKTTTIGPFRAYFKIGEDDTHNARQLTAFNFNFGEDDATRIGSITMNHEPLTNDSWYSLDGQRLNGQPTRKGLYIHGGRKVVVK